MKAVKKVLTLLLILTIISQIFIPSNVKAQNTIRTYDSNSLYDEVAKNAVLDNKRSEYVDSDTGIDFTKGASSTNGQGVYTIASTKDDLYPIHYYRGNIDNNNVLFGGFCWQIVRTTETGGVKLIYNGSPDENGKCENTKVDWSLQTASFQLGLYMYDDINNFISNVYYLYTNWYELANYLSEDIYYNGSYINVFYDDFYYSEEVEYSKETNTYTLKNAEHHNSGDSIDKIKEEKPTYICSYSKECDSVDFILWDIDVGDTYVNKIILSNGITNEDVQKIKKKNLIFSNDVEYKEGKYKLKDTISIPLDELNTEENIKKVLDGHHYLCDNFTNSCENVNYIVNYQDENNLLYVTFKNGVNADNIYNEFKNSTNANDSEMKEVIEEWYSKNLTDDTKYLEDTVWCNDRSRSEIGNNYNKNTNLYSAEYSGDEYKNINLSFSCPNRNDRFTVNSKNGNGKLTYPVATITDIEVVYGGSPLFNKSEENVMTIPKLHIFSYLSKNTSRSNGFLTMTPFNSGDSFFSVYETGTLGQPFNTCKSTNIKTNLTMPILCRSENLVRPMVSLKQSMVVSSGDGSPTNPYEVVEGNTVEYVIDGESPNGFLPPEVESYLKGSKVKMNGLKAGDIINGYRFLGWHSEDVEVVDGAFDMPENKVVFVGKFEKIEDSPLTYDSISKYLTTGIIGVVGLFGLVLLKKKI